MSLPPEWAFKLDQEFMPGSGQPEYCELVREETATPRWRLTSIGASSGYKVSVDKGVRIRTSGDLIM